MQKSKSPDAHVGKLPELTGNKSGNSKIIISPAVSD